MIRRSYADNTTEYGLPRFAHGNRVDRGMVHFFDRLRILVANWISNRVLPKHCNATLKVRAWVYKRIGGLRIGKNVRMIGGSYLLSKNISIGNNVYIGSDCLFNCNDLAKISIGNNCSIAHGVTFSGTTHEIGPSSERAGRFIAGLISVGDGTWIGCNVTILSDCSIGKGVVVAACGLVNRDVEDDVLVGGVPIKIIRELSHDLGRHQEEKVNFKE